ncbi:MAG: ABC transporter ATP-binding protein [Geminicoccaceae bacterium]
MGEAPDIELNGVTKRFGEVRALDGVDLEVPRGAFFTFLGPSGCGKTTALRLISGFEQPTTGEVRIAGRSVVGVPAYRRPVNMVFQHYALFPHLDVGRNLGYGLRQRRPRPDAADIDREVARMLELVRLGGMERRRIWELSGGQQQRVALARALVNRPTVLLLDEPLAALDRKLRRDMQIELQTLQREVGITFVLVTHDQEEALSMSDTICIMRQGRIAQRGSPRALYEEPADAWVADFVGKSNFLEGTVTAQDAAGATVAVAGGQPIAGRRPQGAVPIATGGRAVVAIRPELVTVAAPGSGLAGTVRNRIFLGEHTEYLVHAPPHGDLLALVPRQLEVAGGFAIGDPVGLSWPPGAPLVLAPADPPSPPEPAVSPAPTTGREAA